MTKLTDILYQILLEEKKKRDRCLRIADRRYDKPSAYKSGAVVRCRKGDIWKDLNEGKQVGTLYHYTSAAGLKSILGSNRINASEENYLGNELYYTSFTRNKNFHKKGSNFGVKIKYRITLDGNKLSNKYKIQPFSYIPGWNYEDNWEYDWLEDEPENVRRDFFNATGDYDEQEERISFKNKNGGIDNIKNYILAVDKVEDLQEGRKKKPDPKKGTGKKPEGSSRRLYTDEDPSDTVKVKFSTKQDIIDTFSKASFKSKPHARKSQVINLIHQRVRAAYERSKDPEVKIFAVTRDPIDLIISSYNYISRAGLDHMVADWQIPFDDFLTRMIDPDQYAISLTEDVKRIGESSREALIHVIVHACDLNWMCTKVRDIRRLYGDRFFEFDITEMDTTLLDWLKCNVKDLPDIQNLTTMPSENTAIGWTTLRHKHYAHPMVIRDNLNPYQQKLLTEVSVKTVTWEYRYDIPWLHPSIQPDQTLAGFAHKQHRVAYINVPKCGTMSMDYLLTPFGFEHEVELLSDIQMFIVVRDPVDRLLSGYNFTNKIYDVPSFDQHLIDLANPANKLRMLDTLEQVETWYGHCMPIQKPVFDWYQSHTETPIRIFRLEDTAPLLSWLKTKIPQMKESSVFLQHSSTQ